MPPFFIQSVASDITEYEVLGVFSGQRKRELLVFHWVTTTTQHNYKPTV